MRFRYATILPGLALLLLTAAGGCVKGEYEITINPDGTAKVVMDVVMPPQGNVMKGNETAGAPEKQLAVLKADSLKELLRSSGVDAWENVTAEFRPDGKLHFKGTAYIKDISQINFENMPIPPLVLKKQGDQLHVAVKSDRKKKERQKKSNVSELSDSQLKKFVLLKRAQYQRTKGPMRAFLAELDIKVTYNLPGDLTDVKGFDKKGEQAIALRLRGSEILDEMKEIMARTDEKLIQQIRKRGDFIPIGNGDRRRLPGVFKKLEASSAKVTDVGKPQFDYDEAVKAARKKYPQLKKSLNLGADSNLRLPGKPRRKKPKLPPGANEKPGPDDES